MEHRAGTRKGLGEKEETRMRCMRKTAVSPRKWNARSEEEDGTEAAGRQASSHLHGRANRERGRERTKDRAPTDNRPRKRVSGNATKGLSVIVPRARRPTTRHSWSLPRRTASTRRLSSPSLQLKADGPSLRLKLWKMKPRAGPVPYLCAVLQRRRVAPSAMQWPAFI